MEDKSLEQKLCPNCGSTEYIEDYPTQGKSTCEECGHEVVSINLEVIVEKIEEDQETFLCPSCGKRNRTEKALLNDGETIVRKCKTCGKLYGYRILPSAFWDDEELNDNDFDRKAVAIAKKEGQPIYSARTSEKAKNLLRFQNQNESVADEINKMIKMGAVSTTVNLALEKANDFKEHKGQFTEKQLKYLFSASFDLAQSELLHLGEFRGIRLNERQIAEACDVDRKTIRKWARSLKSNSVNV